MASSARKTKALTAPQPCNSFWVNHFSMLAIYALLIYSSIIDPGLITENILLVPILYALPITLYEILILRVHRRKSVGLATVQGAINIKRVLVKFYGFCMILATIAGLYWLLPEYRGDGYQIFFRLAYSALPHILGFGIIYFTWMDSRLEEPKDDYWHMGMFFLGRWKLVNFKSVQNLARGWAVKGFFLPLMAQFLYNELGGFMNTSIIDWSEPRRHISENDWGLAIENAYNQLANGPFYMVYDQLIRLIFIADLIPACIGYALTVRLMDNHIRSADDSMKGWFFCLICYPPFWAGLFFPHYFPYMDSYNWASWLGGSSVRWLWAGIIVVSLVIYSSASVCFGTRWSNLTFRGLMCNGPYRICKHPAYFFKNLSWWMIGIPFVMEGTFADMIKQCLFAAGVSFVYYQRAVTEERHLSRYPEYRAYGLWMNDHSTLWFLNRLLPFLKYDPARYGYADDPAPAITPKPSASQKRRKKPKE